MVYPHLRPPCAACYQWVRYVTHLSADEGHLTAAAATTPAVPASAPPSAIDDDAIALALSCALCAAPMGVALVPRRVPTFPVHLRSAAKALAGWLVSSAPVFRLAVYQLLEGNLAGALASFTAANDADATPLPLLCSRCHDGHSR